MRFFLFFCGLVTVLSMSSVQAQTLKQTPVGIPELPTPLAAAVEDGAQAKYLGEFEGFYGWALIRQGRPEFYYMNRSGSALVMGLLFDGNGEMITNGQLAQVKANEGETMFAMTGGIDEENNTPVSNAPTYGTQPSAPAASTGLATSFIERPLTPAEEMFVDIRAANWITFGPSGQFEIFAFIDPDCAHCQRFIREAKPLIEDGTFKIRALPIGISAESEKKAALMLAGSNPMDRFIRYGEGDAEALNAPNNINVAGVQKNKQILIDWGFDVTPVIVYRTGQGQIRVIRGRPRDFDTIMQDIVSN